ncbi:CBS domain-containing protein [Virgisporangium aliadipatigenens]|nr:CBS domain-containing protein [Virgisporangium aliadipatigenens]
MRVRDIMSRPVHTVGPDDPIETVAEVLTTHAITAAPVVDADGDLIGIVSEGDLLRRRVPADPTAHLWPVPDPASRPRTAADVMTRAVATAWPAEDISDVAQVMLDCNVRSLPVIEGGQIVGIVSRRDVVRAAVRTDEVLRAELQHRLDEYAGEHLRWNVSVVDGACTVTGVFDDDVEKTVVSVMARTIAGIGTVRMVDAAAAA